MDLEGEGVVDDRASVALSVGQLGEGGDAVEIGEGRGKGREAILLARDVGREALERLVLDRHSAFGGRSDLALDLRQPGCREADRVGHRLAMAERLVQGGFHQRLRGRTSDLDVETQDVVVLDAQRLDPGLGLVVLLEARHDLAAVVAQGTGLVECRIEPCLDETAVAPMGRGLVDQGEAQRLAEAGGGRREPRRDIAQVVGQADGTGECLEPADAGAARRDRITHGREVPGAAAL